MRMVLLGIWVLSTVFMASCANSTSNTGASAIAGIDSTKTSVEPVAFARDLDEIIEDGVLNAITIYSSTSYFLYKGVPMGFEYELLKRLADDLGVELHVTIANDIDDLFKMLNDGQGDIIAYGLTITEPRKKLVDFTQHHFTTYQSLVQKMPDNWRDLPGYKIDKYLITNTLDLLDDTVYVRKNSSYAERIQNLEEEMGGKIHVKYIDGNIPTDEIIKMVVEGKISRTIADHNIASINKTYYPILDIDTKISFAQRVAWAVPKNCNALLRAINEWIKKEKKQDDYYVIFNKYFKDKKSYRRIVQSDFFSKNGNKISQYDELIKSNAKTIGWDWRLLTSQVYQESRFDPNARSWAGAEGLIQLMPSTAKEVGVDNPTDPESNLKGGVRYLAKLWKRFEAIEDSIQRIKFTLASFNCGYGHVVDAQKLAEIEGQEHKVWDNAVENYILKLSDKKYYLHNAVKYGYVRGKEPFNYVKDIFLRFEHYQQFIKK
ncbi:MAG: transporter substrate-binding domain-containing protein [Bacteroidia bacterium]